MQPKWITRNNNHLQFPWTWKWSRKLHHSFLVAIARVNQKQWPPSIPFKMDMVLEIAPFIFDSNRRGSPGTVTTSNSFQNGNGMINYISKGTTRNSDHLHFPSTWKLYGKWHHSFWLQSNGPTGNNNSYKTNIYQIQYKIYILKLSDINRHTQ